ncbi:MAG: aminotransferase class V-fold PLP-dependent enzyme [Patescibacteria group bacterium]
MAKIASLLREIRGSAPTPLLHTDACQAPGQVAVDVQALGVDLMSINSSKVYGPKGVGALYVRRGVMLEPIVGGEQERGLRGGTESVELAAGFAAALEEAEALREREAPRLCALRDSCIEAILQRIPGSHLNGHRSERLPGNVHVSFEGVEGESILLLMDAAGIACATGSACNSFDLAPSHVLVALGEEAGLSHGSIRLTFGRETTQRHVEYGVEQLERIIGFLRGVSALTHPLAV